MSGTEFHYRYLRDEIAAIQTGERAGLRPHPIYWVRRGRSSVQNKKIQMAPLFRAQQEKWKARGLDPPMDNMRTGECGYELHLKYSQWGQGSGTLGNKIMKTRVELRPAQANWEDGKLCPRPLAGTVNGCVGSADASKINLIYRTCPSLPPD